jgi:PPK2 family polyphosphate:nucleotide phosphotransferase
VYPLHARIGHGDWLWLDLKRLAPATWGARLIYLERTENEEPVVIIPPTTPWTVPTDGSFSLDQARCQPPRDAPDKEKAKRALQDQVERLDDLQRRLYADDRHAVLLVFQAMDAAGKDSTIRAVFTGVNPSAFQVTSFKQPSANELDQDFLWRTTRALPQRGRIGVFNRSHYEEVLVVRVHPEYLGAQKLPPDVMPDRLDELWRQRFESIVEHERHLARNGTVILKFWLNVSREEQKRRFLRRLDIPEKNWKFSVGDVDERRYWDNYMAAYEDALRHTSKPWAPWFAIPADDKPFMRLTVARIIADTLEDMGLRYPEVDEKERARFDEMRDHLMNE